MGPLEIAAILVAGCVLQAIAFGLGFRAGRRRPGRITTGRWVQIKRGPIMVTDSDGSPVAAYCAVELLPEPRVLAVVKEVP